MECSICVSDLRSALCECLCAENRPHTCMYTKPPHDHVRMRLSYCAAAVGAAAAAAVATGAPHYARIYHPTQIT